MKNGGRNWEEIKEADPLQRRHFALKGKWRTEGDGGRRQRTGGDLAARNMKPENEQKGKVENQARLTKGKKWHRLALETE